MRDRSAQQVIPACSRPWPAFHFSHGYMRRLLCGTFLLSLLLLLQATVWPQLALPGTTPPPAQPDVPKDTLGRNTPRGTVLGFLSAARKGENNIAAEYLNTRLNGKAAAVLARQLFLVLDRRLPARLNELSDKAEGSAIDLRGSNQESVGAISSESGGVEIVLERVERGSSGSIWLFSSKTLEAIPRVYEEINQIEVDTVLPEFLVNTRVGGVPLFELFAVIPGMPLFYFLTGLLNRLLSAIVGWSRRRLSGNTELPNPECLPGPIRLLLLAFAIHWLVSRISLPLLARQFWSNTAAVITITAIVWLCILLNSWGEGYIHRHLERQSITGPTSVLRLTRRTIDVLIIFVGIVACLYYWGVNPTAAVAGLGVGGIAVALAAQKTLENVIGGVSLILDRALHIGDVLKVGETVGTVYDIGLRSTRIRTLDRTVVSLPNGQVATMSLEIFSARDKFWFHPLIGLRHETDPAQVRAVVTGIQTLLAVHPSVDRESIHVRFLRFGRWSLEVDVFAYIIGRDWNHFLELQEELLLSIMEIVQQAGARLAFPSHMDFAATAHSTGSSIPGAGA